jgi:23S rRNA (pseudouridine1915-N3)-methyltransferase
MRCEILAVGKLKEKYLKDGIGEYQKRLKSVFPVEIREITDQPIPDNASDKDIARALEKEGNALMSLIDDDSFVVALAIDGKELSSLEFAEKMNQWSFNGVRKLIFVIGGSCGLSPQVLQRANFKQSFGKCTYPHQLMRLILMEQIYRTVKINRHEPYHK